MSGALKEFAKASFSDSKADLFAMFIERGFGWCKPNGFNSMVTMQSWMFLSTFVQMRKSLLANRSIVTMAHLGARAFPEISGEVVQTIAFVAQWEPSVFYKPVFFRLVSGLEEDKSNALKSGLGRYDNSMQNEFSRIPGSPIAYWVSTRARDLFERSVPTSRPLSTCILMCTPLGTMSAW